MNPLNIEDGLARKARILWSYTKPKTRRKYNDIHSLLSHVQKGKCADLRSMLDGIEPGLYHYFEFLNTPSDRFTFSISPFVTNEFDQFQKLLIAHTLWESGEVWDWISERLFGDSSFSNVVRRYVNASGIYSDYSMFNEDDPVISTVSLKQDFYKIANIITSLPLNDAFSYSVNAIDENPTLAPHIVTLFKQRCDFSGQKLHALVSEA